MPSTLNSCVLPRMFADVTHRKDANSLVPAHQAACGGSGNGSELGSVAGVGATSTVPSSTSTRSNQASSSGRVLRRIGSVSIDWLCSIIQLPIKARSTTTILALRKMFRDWREQLHTKEITNSLSYTRDSWE